ncbi:S9 family peptidase [Motilimonas eburnea]|uniref:S9 family peptidase n=1 Tax=Motilimonas eburnea TaxID=1737488 RepID=UPI001E310B08|nr:S9 family peptidase [Motilimonas eburnea]MCE2572141.1 S9 family peptidase [Motilimonas eburnea]
MRPPQAEKRPFLIKHHQDIRQDDYYWLRDDSRSDADVLAYLRAENAYCDALMAQWAPLQQSLFEEMTARLQPDEASVPYYKKGYWYQQLYLDGCDYPKLVRYAQSLNAEPQCLLDLNLRSQGHEYYELGEARVSPDQQRVLFSEDCLGGCLYQLVLQDIATGDIIEHGPDDTSGDLVWGSDSQHYYYVKKHPHTLVPYQVWRHVVGQNFSLDQLIYQEADDSYYLGLHVSRSEQFLIIGCYASTSSEAWLVDLNQVDAKAVRFQRRQSGIEYELDHFAGQFFVRTNALGKNFCLVAANEALVESSELAFVDWAVVCPPRDDVLLEDYQLFDDYLVVQERHQGLVNLGYRHWQEDEFRSVSFHDPCYSAWLGHNPEPSSTRLRFGYSSLTTPTSTLEIALSCGQQRLLKQQTVLGGFDVAHYHSERLWISARDGTQVPLSLVYRQGQPLASRPLLVCGYGAYGLSEETAFRSDVLSLLDRGFIYVIAHVRGGEELGRHWYEMGKLAAKHNTFNDFIDVTQGLLGQGYGDAKHVYAMGGSAGGLLMAVVANQAPHLFHGIVAQVPFVDVLTTMLDESLPLTTGEYEEWGNPNVQGDYEYIKSYSPYDQIHQQDYPNLLVMTGLHDSQVQYWEPAKWVAKLRQHHLGEQVLLLHTDLNTGHGGKSGRYQQYHDVAMEYAFLIGLAQAD